MQYVKDSVNFYLHWRVRKVSSTGLVYHGMNCEAVVDVDEKCLSLVFPILFWSDEP